MKSAVALFGGTFNPVHFGHLSCAEKALNHLGVKEVIFLLAGNPPHKLNSRITSGHHRQHMLELALENKPQFSIDARELKREGPSYTLTTLLEYKNEKPDQKIYFLLGGDNLSSMHHWFKVEEVFQLCEPVIVTRPGFPLQFEQRDFPFLSKSRIESLNNLRISWDESDHSSTDIKNRLQTQQSLDGILPDSVINHIKENHLYQ